MVAIILTECHAVTFPMCAVYGKHNPNWLSCSYLPFVYCMYGKHNPNWLSCSYLLAQLCIHCLACFVGSVKFSHWGSTTFCNHIYQYLCTQVNTQPSPHAPHQLFFVPQDALFWWLTRICTVLSEIYWYEVFLFFFSSHMTYNVLPFIANSINCLLLVKLVLESKKK